MTFFRTSILRLITVYLVFVLSGFAAGFVVINFFGVPPAAVFKTSSTRISQVAPIFQAGVDYGIAQWLLIFAWNSLAGLVSIALFYLFPLFDPGRAGQPPRFLRKIIIGQKTMKMLCYLPGCRRIDQEHLRRLYVWLMVPLLGMTLLGLETGMMLAASREHFNNYLTAVMAFLPHGIVEIPAIAAAGAVPVSGHFLMSKNIAGGGQIFPLLEAHKAELPIRQITLAVILGLCLAAFIEARITPSIISFFTG